VAIEIKGGLIVNERGTVVTFRQRCERCGYIFDWNKTTIVPAFGSRKVRPFTCPQCGNYQEVEARHYNPDRQEEHRRVGHERDGASFCRFDFSLPGMGGLRLRDERCRR
jgi:ribosomal protein S27AE